MLNNNLRNCAQTCSYLKIGKNLNYLLLTRSKSKFKGKKQKNMDKVIYEYKNVPDIEKTDFESGEFLPRRLSYLPEGLPQYRGRKIKWWLPDQTPVKLNINPPEYEQEYLDKPNYPPIVEMSTGFMRQKSVERETRLKYYKSLEQLPTFDEKQFEITNLRPIPTFLFKCVSQLYDYLPLYKYITRTHVFENELPLNYSIASTDNQLNDLVNKIKPDILNAIRNSIEFETVNQFFEVPLHLRKGENIARLKKDEALIQNINSICMKQLSINNQCLNNMTTEFNSEVHSWWWGNTFNLSKNLLIYKIEKIKRVNASCQYQDYSPLNIRMNLPIRPPIENQDDVLINQKVPEFPTNPFKLGFQERFWYVSNLPGFLPSIEDNQTTIKTNERSDFPFLTYLNRELLNIRNEMNIDKFNDDDDIIQSMAIIHNFSYLNALAAVHGFTTYSELTYPFTNQCIITNGQYWSFFVYQLNTHSFHSDLQNPDKQNLCWSVNNIKLYDEYKDGEFIGLNDDALKYLVKMYTQKPELTELYSNLRPYLSEDKRPLEIRDQTREDMKRRFAQYVSRREKHCKLSRRTYPFEWVYIRNPESMDKFQRLLKKMRDVFPKEKIQPMAYQYSNQK